METAREIAKDIILKVIDSQLDLSSEQIIDEVELLLQKAFIQPAEYPNNVVQVTEITKRILEAIHDPFGIMGNEEDYISQLITQFAEASYEQGLDDATEDMEAIVKKNRQEAFAECREKAAKRVAEIISMEQAEYVCKQIKDLTPEGKETR